MKMHVKFCNGTWVAKGFGYVSKGPSPAIAANRLLSGLKVMRMRAIFDNPEFWRKR